VNLPPIRVPDPDVSDPGPSLKLSNSQQGSEEVVGFDYNSVLADELLADLIVNAAPTVVHVEEVPLQNSLRAVSPKRRCRKVRSQVASVSKERASWTDWLMAE
jgi:hypothetical protein